MLVLTRKVNEEIEVTIGDIVVKIAYLGDVKRRTSRGWVNEARIGVAAPKQVKILRSELNSN